MTAAPADPVSPRTARLAAAALLCILPALLSALGRVAFGDAPVWGEAAQAFLFALLTAFAAGLTAPVRAGRVTRWPVVTPLAAAFGLALLLLPPARESTLLSWLALALLWTALLHVGLALRGARRVVALASLVALAAIASAIPAAALQWHERFSGEEAFAIVQAAILAAVFLLLLPPVHVVARYSSAPRGFPMRRRWPMLALLALAAALAPITLFRYQASFYDPNPPAYPGITAEQPFLCLPGAASKQAYEGAQVFDRLMANLAANPNKRAPEFGMLALGTGEAQWAQRFREALLDEAAAGRFTGPSNSVKYTQYEASMRAYYVPRVSAAFPALFTPAEQETLAGWFAAINRRALTVEWSDWVYSAALGNRPTGLYENQENGAGLLANLIAGGLEDPSLAAANRAYLRDNIRGWAARFRNTDDTVIYQGEWINNARFQALAGQPSDAAREARAFEWLLLQALPSGNAPAYNYPTQPSIAAVAYLGAVEQGDPRYVWLAGRALDYADAAGKFFPARPGVERPLDLRGASPEVGSCILYGDSGLPTRGGPLAPDKVVLRSGWDADDSYALLNLRFTGWHRYKATNTAPVIAFGAPIVGDQPGRATFAWLPTGRSLFRDKRIRREDLNGLLVPARGLAPALAALTGIGTQWAQDPPWHAEVRRLAQEGAWDVAETAIADWHGWQHIRTTRLHRDGQVIVVVDEAAGPPEDAAELAWHLEGGPWTMDGGALASARTGEGAGARRVIGPSARDGDKWALREAPEGAALLLRGATGGRLTAVTVFLAGPATNADARIEDVGGESKLILQWGGQVQTLPLTRNLR